jgi:Ni/Co efflux regulator RcnB
MRKLVLSTLAVALVVALTADTADARRRHHRHSRGQDARAYAIDRSYAMQRGPATERGGLAALIPSDWRLQPPDPDWKGNRFVSPSGDAWLAFYARPADKTAHDQHLKSVAFVYGEELTYLRREPNWLEVSGFKGDRNFYRKVVLACGARAWRHVAFEYPAEAKRAFEPLIARMARALDRQVEQNCDAVVGSSR